MRSSGPRGEAIVFPDVVSARGRLTRRWTNAVTCPSGLWSALLPHASVDALLGARVAQWAHGQEPCEEHEAAASARSQGFKATHKNSSLAASQSSALSTGRPRSAQNPRRP
jgi:hypothetical protein